MTFSPDAWDHEIPNYSKDRDAARPFPIPDGQYQAQIESAVMQEVGTDDPKPVIKFYMRSIGPTEKGVKFEKLAWLTTPATRDFTWMDLSLCGLNATSWRDIPGLLDSLTDTVMGIVVKTTRKNGKSYTNVYFNERVSYVVGNSTIASTDDPTSPQGKALSQGKRLDDAFNTF